MSGFTIFGIIGEKAFDLAVAYGAMTLRKQKLLTTLAKEDSVDITFNEVEPFGQETCNLYSF